MRKYGVSFGRLLAVGAEVVGVEMSGVGGALSERAEETGVPCLEVERRSRAAALALLGPVPFFDVGGITMESIRFRESTSGVPLFNLTPQFKSLDGHEVDGCSSQQPVKYCRDNEAMKTSPCFECTLCC